jgi:hypothetical protein
LKVEGQLKNIIAGFGTRQFNTIWQSDNQTNSCPVQALQEQAECLLELLIAGLQGRFAL